jgi:hypothetical protein
LKKILSISFLSIFLLAQYGRVLSYVYCKWESRTEVHCDCEKILLFNDHQDDDQLVSLNVNSRWEEPIIADSHIPIQYEIKHLSAFVQAQIPGILKGFSPLPFHPPAVV